MANILIIDDDDDVRNYLMRLVAMFHYTPFCADNCESGRKLMAQTEPRMNVIISDVYLPDGPAEAVKWVVELKSKAKGRPLIIISGAASDDLVAEIEGSKEVMATLTKPFELVFIEELLKRATAAK
jgi:DNA-binding NtrC family response regulator